MCTGGDVNMLPKDPGPIRRAISWATNFGQRLFILPGESRELLLHRAIASVASSFIYRLRFLGGEHTELFDCRDLVSGPKCFVLQSLNCIGAWTIYRAAYYASVLLRCAWTVPFWRFSTMEQYRRFVLSKFLELVTVRGPSSATVRTVFSDKLMPALKLAQGHSHPISAGQRSRASDFCVGVCEQLGLRPRMIQQSASDQRKSIPGTRVTYWAKDANVKVQHDVLEQYDCNVIIDVDYYMNMHEHLTREFVPTLIYTMTPGAACASRKEYSFTFKKDNSLEYCVSGGAKYVHHLYDYGADCLAVGWWGPATSLFDPIVATYSVDRRSIDADHSIVLLTPLRLYTGYVAQLFVNSMGFYALSAFCPVQGNFVRIVIQNATNNYTSTAVVGTLNCATIPTELDNAIASTARLLKTDLAIATVESMITVDQTSEVSKKIAHMQAIVLTEYHRTKIGVPAPCVYPVELSLNRYQFEPSTFDQDAKQSMTAFMNPLMNGAYAPDQTAANERAAVKGRITDVKSDAQLTSTQCQYMREFVHRLIPSPHTLVPTDDDELYERQNRPTQRRILDVAGASMPRDIGQSFVKKETYDGPKDPRLITMFDGCRKREYSKFIYELAKVVEQHEWYAFAKTPLEISARVALLAQRAKVNLGSGDYSRMDGHVAPIVREFEKLLLMYAFRSEYAEELLELYRKHYNITVFGKMCTRYFLGYARGSGGADTALFNTILSALNAYIHNRKKGQNPDEAWANLGLYAGDDSLSVDVDPPVYVRSAESLGQVVDMIVYPHGSSGVDFLARVYSPNVWFGSQDSMCDLSRTISKLHVCVTLPPTVTSVDKFVEKIRGLSYTDYNTPIIKEIVGAWKRIEPNGRSPLPGAEQIASWWSQYDRSVQYPNQDQGWMDAQALSVLPTFDLGLLVRHCGMAMCLLELIKFPICVEALAVKVPKLPCVVNGQLVYPVKPPAIVAALPSVKPVQIATKVSVSVQPPAHKSNKQNQAQKKVKLAKKPTLKLNAKVSAPHSPIGPTSPSYVDTGNAGYSPSSPVQAPLVLALQPSSIPDALSSLALGAAGSPVA